MSTPPRRRRLRPTRVAAALLLIVPIVEVMALIGVGKVIGGWPTFFLLVAMSAFGAWLIGHEGSRAWRALTVIAHIAGRSDRPRGGVRILPVG